MKPRISSNSEILVVRLKSLGDIVLSTIVARELGKSAKVDYLVDETFRGLTLGFPGVRREITRPASWFGRLALMKELRGRYDIVIDMHGSSASAILSRLAARNHVIGYEGKRMSSLYHHHVQTGRANQHTVEVNLGFLDVLGVDRPKDAAIELSGASEVRGRTAVIHAGGRFAHKLWPGERFAEVARHLSGDGFSVSLLLGPGERVPAGLEHLGRLEGVCAKDLGEALKKFQLFVGNDSGPMHIAAAAGCRVVGIFGPSNPARWRPWTSRAAVVSAECTCGFGSQTPCRNPETWCMKTISADRVIEAIKGLE